MNRLVFFGFACFAFSFAISSPCQNSTAEVSCVGIPITRFAKPMMGISSDTSCHDDGHDAVFTCGTRQENPTGFVECAGILHDSGCRDLQNDRMMFGCLSTVPEAYSCSRYYRTVTLDQPVAWNVRVTDVSCSQWYQGNDLARLKKLCNENGPNVNVIASADACSTETLTVSCRP